MKPVFPLVSALAIGGLVLSTGRAWGSFEREFERYNRSASYESLNQLDRQIDVRIEEDRREAEEARLEAEEDEMEKQGKKSERQQKQEAEAQAAAKADTAGAGGGMRWKVQPRISASIVRTSNVFDRRIDPVGETTTVWVPGVEATTSVLKDWKYSSDYSMTFYQNRNFPFNDRFEHDWVQSLSRRGTKLLVNIENALSFFNFRTETEEEELNPIKLNTFTNSLSYKISPKVVLTGYYTNQYVEFKNTPNKASGVHDNTFGFETAYKISPKVELFSDYNYRFARPPKSPETDNFNAQSILFGARGLLSPKLAVNASVGVESREFPTADDGMGVVAQGAVRYMHSPKTDFSLRFQRDTIPTGTESASDPLNQLVDLSVRYRWSPRMSFFAGQSIRFVQGSLNTVKDPYTPGITTTKKDESVRLGSRVGANIRPNPSLSVDLKYQFDRVVDELQIADQTTHEVTLEAKQLF